MTHQAEPPAAEFKVVQHAQDEIKKLKKELKEYRTKEEQVIDVLFSEC